MKANGESSNGGNDQLAINGLTNRNDVVLAMTIQYCNDNGNRLSWRNS